VLSGLPGFRIIVPPYQQSSSTDGEAGKPEQQHQRHVPATKTVLGTSTYSEETLFTPYSNATPTDNTFSPIFPEERDGDINNDDSGALTSRVMQAMFATGVCSGVGGYVFAYYNNNRTTRRASPSSPFRNYGATGMNMATTTTAVQHSHLFFRQEAAATGVTSDVAAFGVYKRSAHEIPNANKNNTALTMTTKTRPSTGALATALSTSFSTSLLFGTKVFLDSSMENQRHEIGMDHHSRPTTSNLLSSAIAGGVVGLSRLAFLQVQQRRRRQQSQLYSLSSIQQQQQQQQQHLTNSSYSLSLMGRHVLAAILYFSIYEGVSSISSSSRGLFDSQQQRQSNADMLNKVSSTSPTVSNSNMSNSVSSGKKGTLNILTGGALAGLAHVATMNYHRYGHYGSTIWWSRIMLPAATRAVPIHALVFYGYERMKEGVKI